MQVIDNINGNALTKRETVPTIIFVLVQCCNCPLRIYSLEQSRKVQTISIYLVAEISILNRYWLSTKILILVISVSDYNLILIRLQTNSCQHHFAGLLEGWVPHL